MMFEQTLFSKITSIILNNLCPSSGSSNCSMGSGPVLVYGFVLGVCCPSLEPLDLFLVHRGPQDWSTKPALASITPRGLVETKMLSRDASRLTRQSIIPVGYRQGVECP